MNQFNPYMQTGYPQMFPQPKPNALPQQQVLQANGKQSIDMLQMAPNSSVLIMDTTAPIVWLCTSDGLGNVSSTPYDISLHKEAPQPDVSSIESRLANVERILEAMTNDKSNARSTKPKQTVRNDGADGTD